MDKFKRISESSFINATGNDDFPLLYTSAGARVEQLKQALRILGESIDEDNFGMQTRTAMQHLGYAPAVMDENKFNEIILRAYKVDKKQTTLTEPELRALYLNEVPEKRRANLTFDKWVKRQHVKEQITAGGKKVFDTIFGWLQIKARGVGSTAGGIQEQPVPTSGGFFARTADGGVAPAVYVGGAIVALGLIAWGVSAISKRGQKVVYVQQPAGAK